MDLGKLEIILKANEISNNLWEEVSEWTYFNKDTIGKQLVRSADSISANLSEGLGRYSYADRKRFAYYARGSLCETINWLEKAIHRGLLEKEKGELILSQVKVLSLRINSFIKTLNPPTSRSL